MHSLQNSTQRRPGARFFSLCGLIALLPMCDLWAEDYRFWTVAGMPQLQGTVDGSGFAARLNQPMGITLDPSGNAYIADTGASVLRKLDAYGKVSTIAVTAKGADGKDIAVSFSTPRGIVRDSAGNLYVLDTGNHAIRKIDTSSYVTTLAGKKVEPNVSPESGSVDGTGEVARFKAPRGIAIDSAGNLYVADTENHTIRMVTPAGVVTTIAGTAGTAGSADGTGAAALFNFPFGVAVDGSGNVYVADSNNHTIRKITPARVVTTLAGTAGQYSSVDGAGAAARFHNPDGIAVDAAGFIYVSDTFNNQIRKISPAGVVTTLAGKKETPESADGVGAAVRFNSPYGIAVDARGYVYVADWRNSTIRMGCDASLPEGRLYNLSIRARAGNNGQPLIFGFSASGSGTSMLLRAIGPTLGNDPFNVPNVMANPMLEVHKTVAGSDTVVASNDNWATEGVATMQAAFASAGAFSLNDTASLDAAKIYSAGGGSTVHVKAVDGASGVVLVEAYDRGGDAASRLVNVSTRNYCGTGEDVLIAGFIVTGKTPVRVLIRAVGPGLSQFDVPNVLADPIIELHTSSNGADVIVDSNDNWGTEPAAKLSAERVGAFALTAASADSALVRLLPPGSYTAVVKGVSSGTGEALLEIYEVR